MADMLTKLDIALHDRVDQLQTRLKELKEASIPTGSDLDVRLEYLGERLDSSRDRFTRAKDIVEDWVDVQIDEIQDWRTQRKVDKLMEQSERSQRHAEAALDVALGALDEAEMAITQAALAQDGVEEIASDRFEEE